MIDIILVILFIGAIVIGYYRGFVWQVLRILQTVVLLAVLYLFGNQIVTYFLPSITPWFETTFLKEVPTFVRPQVSEYIIRIVFSISFYTIVQLLLRNITALFHGRIIKKIPIVGIFNSVLGSVFACLEYILLLLLAVSLLQFLGADTAKYVSEQSYIVAFIQNQFPVIIKSAQVYWS